MEESLSGFRLNLMLKGFAPNARVINLDSEYIPLKPSVPRKLHLDWVKSAWSKGLRKWEKNLADCDDWAWLFRAWCLHRHLIQNGKQEAIPVGYLHYTIDGHGYHAANLIAVAEKGDEDIWNRTRFIPFEPQPNGGEISLSEKELKSIDLIII